jgi:hypothetical protein
MGVSFPKPKFDFSYDLDKEKLCFDEYFDKSKRGIPKKKNNEIDLATWNIANLGIQSRGENELGLIAYILSKFDIIAIQEVNEKLGHFDKIMADPVLSEFDYVLTDAAGNKERLTVAYRKYLIEPKQLFAELGYNPCGKTVNNKYVLEPAVQTHTLQGKKTKIEFYNFSRNPFLSTWQVKNRNTCFLLTNAHIYYGDDVIGSAKYNNRIAEVYFLADWASKQRQKEGKESIYESNVILLGDMNVPKMDSNDPVYRALKRKGLVPSRYSTEAGTTVQEFCQYDQVVFTNEKLKVVEIENQRAVVVDYDNFMFKDLWAQVISKERTLTQFKAWCRWAISDHRPLFVRLKAS